MSDMPRPVAQYPERSVRRIVVLHDGPNPSTDIYLRSRLSAPGSPPVDYVDIAQPPGGRDCVLSASAEGAFVVVCRYITGPWLGVLESVKHRLAGLAYFADDDLPAMLADRTLPIRYRLKIWRRFTRHVDRLSALASEFWVATPSLAERYGDRDAMVLPPLCIDRPDENSRYIRYFYHGSSSHKAEQHFLVDVVREVQQRNPRMLFEIIGDRKVRNLFRGIERVTVLHPMNWPTYLAYTSSTRQDIGLAPLLGGAVNSARSYSKLYDITRTGAVGIYSDRIPYTRVISDGKDGILLQDSLGLWIDEILSLACNKMRREKLLHAAVARHVLCNRPLCRDGLHGLINIQEVC